MRNKVLILYAEPDDSQSMCALLAEHFYMGVPVDSLANLKRHLSNGEYLAVIMDIDSVPLDNRSIRNLVFEYPGTCILCVSKDRFHPELKDAICYHIHACLRKPVDPDELQFWLRSIRDNEVDSGVPS